jgi:hypothetical protein
MILQLKPRSILTSLLAAMALLLVYIGCRKVDTRHSPTEKFGVAEAKEWWYAQFRKSPGYKELSPQSPYVISLGGASTQKAMQTNSNQTVSINKYPVWSMGQAFNTGAYQLTEFPLLYPTVLATLPEAPLLTDAQERKIAECSLNRVIIMKTPGGQTEVRITTIIPRYEHAATKQFDISGNSMRHFEAGFKGWVVVRKWNEEIVNIFEVVDGHIIKTMNMGATAVQKSSTANMTSRSSGDDDCNYQEVTIWKKVCEQGPCTPPQDIPCVNACATWEMVPEIDWQWVCTLDNGNVDCAASQLPYEQCMCYYYGLNCTGGGGDDGGAGNFFGNDPCAIADSLKKDIGLLVWTEILKDSINGRHERLLLFKIQNGNYINVGDTVGIIDSLGAPDLFLLPGVKIDGLSHNHFNTTRTLNIFSTPDLYTLGSLFINNNIENSNTFVFSLVTPTNRNYALFIQDSVKFSEFFHGYSLNQNLGMGMLQSRFDQLKIKPDNTPDDNEKKFLKFLKDNKTGLVLLKNNTGEANWNPLKLENNNVLSIPCPQN